MTLTASYLREMDREALTTRKMLSIVPEDQYDWKPHEKSMTLRQLATHVAEIPGWVQTVLTTSELDFAKNEYKPLQPENAKVLLEHFENSLEKGRAALRSADDKQLDDSWTMRAGDQVFSTESKFDWIRHCFCQVVHHRAQLGVYLRLLNVPIPGSYGPSADETSF